MLLGKVARRAGGLAVVAILAWGLAAPAASAASCPCTIWPDSAAPANPAVTDNQPIEVGVKFRADEAGFVTSLRFYKGSANVGTHVGHLWAGDGTQLAEATFVGETASGWQEVALVSPVAVAAGTTYVATYHSSLGFFAIDAGYFSAGGIDSPPLHALAAGEDGPNGVFRYGASGFPTDGNTANYWVDVVFTQSVNDETPPSISGVTATAGPSGHEAAIRWTTDEPSDSIVHYGTDPASLDQQLSEDQSVLDHDVDLTGLEPETPYFYRVSSTDAAGNTALWPPSGPPATFSTGPTAVVDTTVDDFAAGTTDAGTYVSDVAGGEVSLSPTVGAEFDGPGLPSGWFATPWNPGGTATVSGGQVTVDGALAGTDATFTAGRSLEFVATFSATPFQHVGLGTTFNDAPWAMFSTGSDGASVKARTWAGGPMNDTVIPLSLLGTPHRYRVEWQADAVDFFVDGAPVASHGETIATEMRPMASDFATGGGALTVDWVHLSPWATSGDFRSRILDAGGPAAWGAATWAADVPAGTSLVMSVRTGETPVPDTTWTDFVALAGSGADVPGSSRYVQYQLSLSGDGTTTPVLADVAIAYEPAESPAPTIGSFRPTKGTVGKAVTITGSGFTAATSLSFNGTTATFTVVSDGTVTTNVPSGALTGPITITTPAGSDTSDASFVVKPKITSFSPKSGSPGTVVVISGSAFTGATRVRFNGVKAAFTVNSYGQISATVPARATTGPIQVVTPSGTATTKNNFTVT